MNVSVTHLTNDNTGGSTSFTTASITPPSNQLVIVTVAQNLAGGDGSPVPTPSVSGCNMTWQLIGTRLNSTDDQQRISIFRGMAANPTTGALTIQTTFSSTSCFWSVDSFRPTAKNGSNGSGAVVQYGTASADTTDPLNMTISLSTFGNSKNATFAAVISPDTASTPSGFTKIVSASQDLGPDNKFGVYFKTSPATSMNFTATGSGAGVSTGIAAEIKFKKPGGAFISLI